MIGASGLSGDTLVACHFPVVQLPTWQLPVQALCSSAAKRPGRLCSAGLTRAVSLPERDSLTREHAFAGGRRHFSNSYGSLNEDRAEEEGGSDSSGRYDSNSSPEEVSFHPRRGSSAARGGPQSHNSFLPNAELDAEDEDSDGGNLHRYHEDSSFMLHGNSNWTLSNEAGIYPMSHGDAEWISEGTMLGPDGDQEWFSHPSNPMDSLRTDCQCFQVSSSGVVGRNSEGTRDNVFPPAEYVTDSSCNSSDGVLVNFCAIYDRSNNPATPHDLSSPAVHPSQSSEGSVFLNLQPVPSSAEVEADATPSASGWSPQGLDSNCNLYTLEPLPPGLSSLEVSDLTACLQGQATLSMGTNQKYYKLVTCDLSSQSPSPAWSSHASCPEAQIRSSPFPPSEDPFFDRKKEGLQKEVQKETNDQQQERRFSSTQFDSSPFSTHGYPPCATTSAEKVLCRQKHADAIQTRSHVAFSLCPGQDSPHSSNSQERSVSSTRPSVIPGWEKGSAAEKGACSMEPEVVRFPKAQRPTSLPIQPFVLVPTGKQEAQQLGCLLEQYMNQKGGKSGSSQPGFKFKGKRSQCFSNLQLSPMGSRYPVFLEAPSSSDTCSTCTPSPECVGRRHTWSQSSRSRGRASPCASKSSLDACYTSPKGAQVQLPESPQSCKTQTNLFPNQPPLVKIPTYQDLIHLTPKRRQQAPVSGQPHTSYQPLSSHTPPTLPLSTDTHHPSTTTSSQLEKKIPPPPRRAAPAADSGFFHSGFTAALSSVAPLSSLTSLLSLAASARLGGPSSQTSESLVMSDKPPTEFCLSPDMSYESMSLSHLQRRGLLRSVSRAVDLIMAHFGSSRDPYEKMRLGNSSRSPTIAGLVLEHLCPTIQNILEDGLRDHKLDLIIGQRRNHCWSVVEVSTRIGPSTRVLQSLVTKIRQCPQLTSHCMKLRAFIMGLLNLRALEFWLSHLQSQKDVVATHYHSWGFLSMSLGRCRPLFEELLLTLQPLSVLPFDLNLLLEPRLLRNRQLCSEDDGASPPPPCSALLVTSWPLLQADREVESNRGGPQTISQQELLHRQGPFSSPRRDGEETQAGRSPALAPIPEWIPAEPELVDDVFEADECSQNNTDNWSQISMYSRRGEEDHGSPHASNVQAESPCQGWPRWAKLFGAADTSSRMETLCQSHTAAQSRSYKRPSQWLHLDRSQLGLLAQSIRSIKLGGGLTDRDH